MGFGFLVLLLTLALIGAAFAAFNHRKKRQGDARPAERADENRTRDHA